MLNPKQQLMLNNMRFYEDKLRFYPHDYCIPRTKPERFRPEKFQKAYPHIKFVRVPISDLATWMFETQRDRETFKSWVKQNGGFLSEHYQH